MNNYEQLIKIIDDIEPTPSILHLRKYTAPFSSNVQFALGSRVNHMTLVACNKDTDNCDVLNDLVYSNIVEYFNKSKLKNIVDRDRITEKCLGKVKDELVEWFCTVSPNAKPKLTGIYKILNRKIYFNLSDEHNNMVLSIWLYLTKNKTDMIEKSEIHTKNLYGLLCIAAKKIDKM